MCVGGALLVNVSILPDGIWQMAARFQADAAAYPRAGLLRIVKVGAHPASSGSRLVRTVGTNFVYSELLRFEPNKT